MHFSPCDIISHKHKNEDICIFRLVIYSSYNINYILINMDEKQLTVLKFGFHSYFETQETILCNENTSLTRACLILLSLPQTWILIKKILVDFYRLSVNIMKCKNLLKQRKCISNFLQTVWKRDTKSLPTNSFVTILTDLRSEDVHSQRDRYIHKWGGEGYLNERRLLAG